MPPQLLPTGSLMLTSEQHAGRGTKQFKPCQQAENPSGVVHTRVVSFSLKPELISRLQQRHWYRLSESLGPSRIPRLSQ